MSTTTAILHLLFIGIMLLILVGGPVAILILWYTRGRDPQIGPVAEYLSEPPDDLSPGAAGTLVDEHADHHDVIATLLGLGRHGAVTIVQHAPDEPTRKLRPGDYEVIVVDPSHIESLLERKLLTALFGRQPDAGDRVTLGEVHGRFTTAEPTIREALYDELVAHRFFTVSPAVTRRRWQWISRAIIVASIVLGVYLGVAVDPFAFAAGVAGVIIGFVLLRVSRAMPRKTLEGAEAAAKWRAFRTYLKDIRRYETVEEAKDLFDRYLAYAVAFELDKQWVRTFAAAGSARPGWLQVEGQGANVGDVIFTAMEMGRIFGGPHGHGVPSGDGRGGLDVGLPNLGDINMPDVGMPDVDLGSLSDALGGGLQGASDALSGLFDVAGSIFDAIDFDN